MNRFLMIRRKKKSGEQLVPYSEMSHAEYVREIDRLYTQLGFTRQGPLQIVNTPRLIVLKRAA